MFFVLSQRTQLEAHRFAYIHRLLIIRKCIAILYSISDFQYAIHNFLRIVIKGMFKCHIVRKVCLSGIHV